MQRATAFAFLTMALAMPFLSACSKKEAEVATPPGEQTVVFTHVTVIDGTPAPEKTDHTVVITGQRITAVGPSRQVVIPPGARVIEGRRKFLIPGLWDMHVHLQAGTQDVLPVFLANGVTGIRELDTAIPEIERIRALGREGTLLQPRIMAAGNMIEAAEVKDMLAKMAPPIIVKFAAGDRVFVKTAAEARQAVQTLAALKPDLLKLHVTLKKDIYLAVLDEASKNGLRVAAHYPTPKEPVTLKEIADAGQATVEHLGWPGAADELQRYRGVERRELMKHLKEKRVAFVPTLVTGNADGQQSFMEKAGDNSAEARIQRAHKDPRARFVSPALWETWRGMIETLDNAKKMGGFPKSDLKMEVATLREFQEAGIGVLPGTDFTVQFLFPGSSLHEELAQLVKQVGMTPNEVIQAATRLSAESLGLDKELGTIEPGKLANIVLLDANPLTDIANAQQILAVVYEGRLYDRQELDKQLDAAAERIAKAPKPDAESVQPAAGSAVKAAEKSVEAGGQKEITG